MALARSFGKAIHAIVKQVGEKIALLPGKNFLALGKQGQKDREAIDKAATQDNLSRSGFLQEASSFYLAHRREQREAVERKGRRQKAAAEMDRLAEKFGKWDGVKIIRHFRDSRSKLKP